MPKRKVSLEGAQIKPSLASLKPDKTKGQAAQKRAVKRIVASASKKTTATRIKKISDSISANTASKLPSKKTAVKSIPKKASLQRPLIAKARKTTFSPKAKVQATLIPEEDWKLTLPSTMSIRAREKALALLTNIIDDFYQPAQRIAYVSGACFLLLGSYLALSFSGVLPQSGFHTAMLINSAGTTSMTSVAPQSESTSPVFSLLESIPTELNGDSRFTFSLTRVKNVTVSVYSLSSGTRRDLAIDELVPGTFRYSIEVGALTSGHFVAKVSADSNSDTSRYTYELGEFTISSATVTSTSTATSSSDTGSSLALSKEQETKSQATSSEPVSEVYSTLHLSAEAALTGNASIQVSAPEDARFVEMYVRPLRSINARFLGSAEKKSDKWYYFFNTLNVPNGDYELFARTRINDVFNESNSVNTRITNIAEFTLPDSATSTELLKDGESIDEAALPARTFSEGSFVDASSSASRDTVAAEADEIFALHKDELGTRLDRYAVAVQSGDELLKKTALDELLKLKDSILLAVLNDSSRNYLADNVSQEFDNRLEILKRRISTFEELRRTAGSENTRTDSDRDGISDYDERSLYRTNPDLSDTDNDGFTDGIEIMRGFDPRSPLGETVINYQLPQNVFGLVKTNELRIDVVNPLLNIVSNSESVTQAEIKGAGLPNSYVTLYVMSSPNITTVRTGSDGSFSYTFEKELEDGEHTVYAAITDNAGTIVAMSDPYHFVKKGSDFYANNALSEGDNNTAALGMLARISMFNIVVGVGILALGIILILLAVSLRRQPTIKKYT